MLADAGCATLYAMAVSSFTLSVLALSAGAAAFVCAVSALLAWRRGSAAERRAMRDPLTGIANRDVLTLRLQTALGQAARSGRAVGVAFCDIDDFKATNDAFGHAAGDLVLVCVAQRLAGAVRPDDVVARLGGDEFAVVCGGLRSADDMAAVAQRLRDAVCCPVELHTCTGSGVETGAAIGADADPTDADPTDADPTSLGSADIGPVTVPVRVSVGYATSRGGSADDLLARADMAMYAAKRRLPHRRQSDSDSRVAAVAAVAAQMPSQQSRSSERRRSLERAGVLRGGQHGPDSPVHDPFDFLEHG